MRSSADFLIILSGWKKKCNLIKIQ